MVWDYQNIFKQTNNESASKINLFSLKLIITYKYNLFIKIQLNNLH